MKTNSRWGRAERLAAVAAAAAMVTITGGAPADAQILGFQHVYGGSNVERGDGGVIRTSDGNVVAVGTTASYAPNNTNDVMVVKMDICGNVIWAKTYDLGGNDIGRKIRETNDGLVVVGSTESLTSPNKDGFVMKLNSLGSWNWTHVFGVNASGKEDELRDVRIDPVTHDIYAAGFTNSSGAGNYDAWMLKINPFGFTQWNKTYGKSGEDMLLALDIACSGSLVATGSTRSDTQGDKDIYMLAVVANNGGLIWSKRRGGAGDEQGNSIVADNDPFNSRFYIAGKTNTGFTSTAEYVAENNCTNAAAVAQNTMHRGNFNSELNEIQVDSLMRPHVIGTTDDGTGFTKMHAMRLNPVTVGVFWSKLYGGTKNDLGFALVPTYDRLFNGNYCWTLFGTSSSYGLPAATPNLYAVGIDANGISGCDRPDFVVDQANPGFPTVTLTPTIANFPNERAIVITDAFHEDNLETCPCGNAIHLRGAGGEILSEIPVQPGADAVGLANHPVVDTAGR
jgi:hypothetical protein